MNGCDAVGAGAPPPPLAPKTKLGGEAVAPTVKLGLPLHHYLILLEPLALLVWRVHPVVMGELLNYKLILI